MVSKQNGGNPERNPQVKGTRGRPKKPNKLLEEAKKFTEQRLPPEKNLDTRMYLAGQAMTGLLARQTGYVRFEELKRQAFEIADSMLRDD